ncbi:MAG TPA: HAD family phosphatase [Candidatus Acidoferrum sp.]|nr:HAD family phosphatase [Candidatus Acidoferrum sp.]
MAEVTALFWDNGGVILTNGWDRDARKRAIEKFQLDPAEFEDRHELVLDAFETGALSLEDYLRRTVFYRPRPYTPEDFEKFMFEQSQPYPDSLEFAEALARSRKYLMATLNNESLEINEYRIRRFKLRDCFEAFFSSCYLGVRKPEAGIYTLALKITQREPAECILIDDRGLNLECARELGIQTIQFKNVSQLRDDLARLGVTADQAASDRKFGTAGRD